MNLYGASGSWNWSDTTKWFEDQARTVPHGAAPTTGDTADLNGGTVTMDVDTITCTEINTNNGGSLTGSGNKTINANLVAGASTVITAWGGLIVNGNVTGSSATGSAGIAINGLVGTLIVNGDMTTGVLNGAIRSVSDSPSGIVVVVGNIIGAATLAASLYIQHAVGSFNVIGDFSQQSAVNWGSSSKLVIRGNINTGSHTGNGATVLNAGTGTIDVIGNVTAGAGTSGNNQHGIENQSTGTVNIVGDVTGGTGGGGVGGTGQIGALNTSTGTMNITGIATGGDGTNAIAGFHAGARNSGTGTLQINGASVGSASGTGNPGVYGVNINGKTLVVGTTQAGAGGAAPTLGYVAVNAPSLADIAVAVRTEMDANSADLNTLIAGVNVTSINGIAALNAIIHSGTAQAGSTSTTIVLSTGGSGSNSAYVGAAVLITGGTGVGQSARVITVYVGATRTATVDVPWGITPDGTTTYAILPAAGVPRDSALASYATSGDLSGLAGDSITIDNDAIEITN